MDVAYVGSCPSIGTKQTVMSHHCEISHSTFSTDRHISVGGGRGGVGAYHERGNLRRGEIC